MPSARELLWLLLSATAHAPFGLKSLPKVARFLWGEAEKEEEVSKLLSDFFFWLDLNKMIIFGLFIFVPCWVVALGSVVAISCPAVPLKMGLFLHNQFGFCFSH